MYHNLLSSISTKSKRTNLHNEGHKRVVILFRFPMSPIGLLGTRNHPTHLLIHSTLFFTQKGSRYCTRLQSGQEAFI